MEHVKIGIIDSGVGGISIFKEVHKLLPSADYYYFADDKNNPYGNKDRNDLLTFIDIAVKELLTKDIDLIIIACNTATAVAIDELRTKYSTLFVGVEPFINIINTSSELSRDDIKVGVLTTNLMKSEERFKFLLKKYDPQNKITHHVSSHLALLVENWFYADSKDKFKQKIEDELLPLKQFKYTHLILGCTHYPLIQDIIQKTLNIKTICPSSGVARRVGFLLNNVYETDHYTSSILHFYSSKKNEWKELKISKIP
ncbi:MAG: glutamate racemase [Bdellovibrionales bacterium]|jgi:glutamate racemase|nr:glutamate racemase [Bdellovibrionales bacterium]